MNVTEVKKKVVLIRIVTFFEKVIAFARLYSFEVATFVSCFFLSFAFVGGVNPFGVCFLCACEKKKNSVLEKISALLGVSFSSLFFENGVFTFLSALCAFAFVTLPKITQFSKGISRVLSFILPVLCFIPLGKTAFFTAVVLCPLFAVAFSGLFHKERAVLPHVADSGFLCLAFACTLAFTNMDFGFLSFGVACAVFFSLEGGEKGGYFLGALSGFFAGLALGAELIVPFVIGGFVCGMYVRKSRSMGVLLLLLSWAIFVFVTYYRWVGVLISVAWGVSFWVALSGLYLDKKRVEAPQCFSKFKVKSDKKLSEAIGGISLALSSVSKAKRREREEKVKTVVDSVVCSECETCVGCSVPTEQLRIRLCQRVLKNQKILSTDFSDSFKESCSRWYFMEERLNEVVENSSYKTSVRIDTLAEDYMAMSRILACGEKNAETQTYRDVSLANKIKIALELKNIRVSKVEVTGVRLPLVEIFGIPFKLPFPEKTVVGEVERVLGRSVETVFLEAEGKSAKMGLKAVCPLKADFYKISIPKKGEIICGDSISSFFAEDGFFYSIISDGMGSGRDAAVCSRLGTVFLEKLISAGINKSQAVSMLGNVISSSEDEIFTTVDLLEVDLVRGKLSCIKAGASPTWILRNKRAYTVSSKTLPCGIIGGATAEQTILECFSGDTIIMASDGGDSALNEAVTELLKSNRAFSSKEISAFLVDVATKKIGRNDDISFCVINVL